MEAYVSEIETRAHCRSTVLAYDASTCKNASLDLKYLLRRRDLDGKGASKG